MCKKNIILQQRKFHDEVHILHIHKIPGVSFVNNYAKMYSPIIYANEGNQANRLRIHSPGRINLIGEHTDYNNGYVLPAAIDRVIWMSAAKNDKPFVTASSIDFEQRIQFPIILLAVSCWPLAIGPSQ
jgi:hypothetical protein